MIDAVTGLVSQPFLFERLEEELDRGRRYGRPLSVMMVDVDGLKRINEETHRLFGSYVLREVGELLSKSLRRCDSVFRYEAVNTGRYRQFYQIDCEAYGVGEPTLGDHLKQIGVRGAEGRDGRTASLPQAMTLRQ